MGRLDELLEIFLVPFQMLKVTISSDRLEIDSGGSRFDPCLTGLLSLRRRIDHVDHSFLTRNS